MHSLHTIGVAIAAVVCGTLIAAFPTAVDASCATGDGPDAEVGVWWWPLGYRCAYDDGTVTHLSASVPTSLLCIALCGIALWWSMARRDDGAARGVIGCILLLAVLGAMALSQFELTGVFIGGVWVGVLLVLVVDGALRPAGDRSFGGSSVAAFVVTLPVVFVACFFWLFEWPWVGIALAPAVAALGGRFPDRLFRASVRPAVP